MSRYNLSDRVTRQPMHKCQFIRLHQCLIRSFAAFEKSEYADDWRELMRLYMVCRTRSFMMICSALNRFPAILASFLNRKS